MFTVDALKQINLKYLPLDVTVKKFYQKELVKPFEVIANTKTRSVREYVVECLYTIITARAPVVHSGWGAILRILGAQVILKNKNFYFFVVLLGQG